ncbi:hypothetical protein CR513_09237, partial [Mucuna pruriens]
MACRHILKKNPIVGSMKIHKEKRPITRNDEAQERLQFLEDQLKAIEGIGKHNFKASDLCLVLDVTIPYKFKVPRL